MNYFDAVYALIGGRMGGPSHGPVSEFVFDDGQTLPTEKQIQAKLSELQATYDAQEYARSRKTEYDKLNQNEMMYDDEVNSTTTWKDAIDAIKAKYPKPE
jgi:hypothetical protein